MALYRDTPEDSLQDDFDEIIFQNHALGRNILGTEETVSSFKKEDFINFIGKHIDTSKIILSSVGSFSFNKILKLAEKYVGDIQQMSSNRNRIDYQGYKPVNIEVRKPISQAHCAVGTTTYPLQHPDRLKLFMLLNILGGPGMNSRLNLSLREKYGYVNGIAASYSPFPDTGALGIYFATEQRNLKKSLQLIWKEFDKLKNQSMGRLQLHTAKQQLKGQLAMSEENYSGMMLMMAKSMLDLNEIISIDTIFNKIDQVTAYDLLEIANDVLEKDQMSVLSYLPE